MVQRKSKHIDIAPFFSMTFSSEAFGVSLGIAKLIIAAGMRKLMSAGMNKAKNPKNSTLPDCQTISVVISPNGLNAPPALAATTILINAKDTNFGLSDPTANTTAPINKAVVKLSATGEIKKAKNPEIQKSFL